MIYCDSIVIAHPPAGPPPPPLSPTTPLNLVIILETFSQGPHPKRTAEKLANFLKITITLLDRLHTLS